MWCVDLFNSVYVQWNLCYNCKFTKFDTKLNVQIPVEFRSKVLTETGTGTGTKMLFRYRNRNRNSGRSMWYIRNERVNKSSSDAPGALKLFSLYKFSLASFCEELHVFFALIFPIFRTLGEVKDVV